MSSIFDALKKLEDEKSPQKSAKEGGDLFQPPQRGGGRFRGIAGWVVVFVIMAGGAYYLLGGEDEGEAPGEAPATDRLAVSEPVQTPLAVPEPPAPAFQETAPAVQPAPPASKEQTVAAPAILPLRPIMTEEQERARKQFLKRLADLRDNPGAVALAPEDAPGEVENPTPPPSREALVAVARARAEAAAGIAQSAPVPPPPAPPEHEKAGASPLQPPAPSPVKTPPAPAAPSPEPTQIVRAEPPEAPVEEMTEASEGEAAATGEMEAVAPERPVLVKSQAPMLMVTEVTYHRRPEQRSARIRLGDASPRLVREGDRFQGLEVKEIMAGAITLELAGSDVVVDVGESLSFTVMEPDFH